MGVRPIPVLVVSGHTDASADLTLTALETGAIDCIQKPDGRPDEIDRFIADTADGLIRAAQSNHRARAVTAPAWPGGIVDCAAGRPHRRARRGRPVNPTGSSASALPRAACRPCARWSPASAAVGLPIVVVQHMPPTFTGRLAARLARRRDGLPGSAGQ